MLESRCLLAAGDLDFTFGDLVSPPPNRSGILKSNLGSDESFGDMVVSSDGKIIAAGTRSSLLTASIPLVVAKYSSSGDLVPSAGGADPSGFGTDGKVELFLEPFGIAVQRVTGVALQGDKILATGWGTDTTVGDSRSFVVRLKVDGTLDDSFDLDGFLGFEFNGSMGDSRANDIAYSPTAGRIYVGGTSFDTAHMNRDFALVAITETGAIDTTFGTAGTALVDFQGIPDWIDIGGLGSYESLNRMLVQPVDGSILLAGYIENANAFSSGAAIARVTSGGVLDTTFGSIAGGARSGRAIEKGGAAGLRVRSADGIALQSDGIVIAASVEKNTDIASTVQGIAVFRQDANGTLDSSFGANGFRDFSVSNGAARDIAVQTNGAIVLTAFGLDPVEVGVIDPDDGTPLLINVRLAANGTLDPNWGTGGIVNTKGVSENWFRFPRMTSIIQFDGKLLVGSDLAGARGAGDLLFVRLLGDPVNQPPVANDDSYSAQEDMLRELHDGGVPFWANDTDADGDYPLTPHIVSGPSFGTFATSGVAPVIVYTYTPARNFFGEDQITYQVEDARGALSNVATVTLTVQAQNDLPVAVDVLESSRDAVNLRSLIPAGMPIAFTLSASGSGVILNDNDAFEIVGDVLKFRSPPDFEGPMSLQGTNDYEVIVGLSSAGQTENQLFKVRVLDVNEAPTDLLLAPSRTDENVPAGTVVGTLSTIDPDSGDSHTYSLVAGDGDTDNGNFTVTGDQLIIGVRPDFETKSSYSIRVRTQDAGGLRFDKEVSIAVNDLPDQPPIAEDDNYTTLADEVLRIAAPPALDSVLANDHDPDPGTTLSVSSTQATSLRGATITVDDNGGITYDPTGVAGFKSLGANESLDDTFEYTASDGTLTSNVATVTVTVIGVNDAPTGLVLSAFSIDENVPVGTVIGAFTTTDADVGDTHTYSLVAGAGDTDNASFTVSGNQLKITQGPHFETKSNYSIRVRTTDSGGLSFERPVIITVNKTQTTAEDTPFGLSGLPLPTNIPASSASVEVTLSVDHGTFNNGQKSFMRTDGYALMVINLLSGIATYTPDANYNGDDTLTVTFVSRNADGVAAAPVTYTVPITVTPINDAPKNILPAELSALGDTALVIHGVSVNDVDAGSGNVKVTVSVNNGTLSVVSTGVTIVPDAGPAASLTMTGTLTAINAVLNSGVTYTPNQGFKGGDLLSVVTDDSPSAGGGGLQTESSLTIDVGNYQISGSVFSDTNNNFVRNTTERGIGGVEVTLTDASGAAIVKTTAADGLYSFSELPAGRYTVEVTDLEFFSRFGVSRIGGETLSSSSKHLSVFIDRTTAHYEGGLAGVFQLYFAPLGLEPQYLSTHDLLASTPRTGVLFALDGDKTEWFVVLNGWCCVRKFTSSYSPDRASLSFRVETLDGVWERTISTSATNPAVRFQGNVGNSRLIRIYGTPAEFGIEKVPRIVRGDPNAADTLVIDQRTATYRLNRGEPKPFFDDFTSEFEFDGGGGGDAMSIIGTHTDLSFQPDPDVNGDGVINVPGFPPIRFKNLKPVDFEDVAALQFLGSGSGAEILISDDFNSTPTSLDEAPGMVPAWKISGTSGGIGFEQAHLFRSQSLVLDTSTIDGDDTFTFSATTNVLSDQFSIKSGAGSDTVVFDKSVRLAELPLGQIDLGTGANRLRFIAAGNVIDLTTIPPGKLLGIQTLDFGSGGGNMLKLDAARVQEMVGSGGMLELLIGTTDTVEFGAGWQVTGTTVRDNQFYRILEQAGVQIELAGALPWQNPLLALDVNRDGTISPVDALIVVNELNSPVFSELNRVLRDPTTLAAIEIFFVDVDGDNSVAPIDVLLVINHLNAQLGSGEGPILSPINMTVRESIDQADSPWPQASLLTSPLPEHSAQSTPRRNTSSTNHVSRLAEHPHAAGRVADLQNALATNRQRLFAAAKVQELWETTELEDLFDRV